MLDSVAPFKSETISSVKSSPWINESICSFRRNCLWKATKLEVHQLHLMELLISLNEMIRVARTAYFANIISSYKGNSKVLLETINSIVSPTASKVPVLSDTDCNNLLDCFVDKVSDIRANIPPSSNSPSIGVPCDTTLRSFSPVSLEDVTKLLHKIKPSSGPLDIPLIQLVPLL